MVEEQNMVPNRQTWSNGPLTIQRREFPQGAQWSVILEETTLVVISEDIALRIINGQWTWQGYDDE